MTIGESLRRLKIRGQGAEWSASQGAGARRSMRPPAGRRTGALDEGRKLGLFEDIVEEEGDTGRANF